MKTLSTLPQTLYAVAIVIDGMVYGEVTGPYRRRYDAVTALAELNRIKHNDHRIVMKTRLSWTEDK